MTAAVPHSEVEDEELYKHVSQDLIEPKRMRQLAVWASSRAMEALHPTHATTTTTTKTTASSSTAELAARQAARAIAEQIHEAFGARDELSNWFNRDKKPSSSSSDGGQALAAASIVTKPNPRNAADAIKAAEMESRLAE